MSTFSVRNPYFIIVVCLVVAVLGFVAIAGMPVDLFPTIRLNAVSPGAMVTAIGRHTAEAKGIAYAPSTQADAGGAADPMRVAHAHLFLVSDESSYVTGVSLIADGGQILKS